MPTNKQTSYEYINSAKCIVSILWFIIFIYSTNNFFLCNCVIFSFFMKKKISSYKHNPRRFYHLRNLFKIGTSIIVNMKVSQFFFFFWILQKTIDLNIIITNTFVLRIKHSKKLLSDLLLNWIYIVLYIYTCYSFEYILQL